MHPPGQILATGLTCTTFNNHDDDNNNNNYDGNEFNDNNIIKYNINENYILMHIEMPKIVIQRIMN